MNKSDSEMYDEYLRKHVSTIIEIFNTRILPILTSREEFPLYVINIIKDNLEHHDESKYSSKEWVPYLTYFYTEDHSDESLRLYDAAWNHHQKTNPHHWQYWVMINDTDEPQIKPLDMPFEYIIEMLCDWASCGTFYNDTAYSWYTKNKDKMILSDKTRALVEEYIEYLK